MSFKLSLLKDGIIVGIISGVAQLIQHLMMKKVVVLVHQNRDIGEI